VSRFRMAILLTLLAVTALPTTAHARRIAYCHLFSPEAVGKAVNYRGITVKGSETAAPSLNSAAGTMTVCDFWSGRDRVAESTVMTFKTAKTTATQLKLQIGGRASDHPRRVSGPWQRAYAISNTEMFVLKGRHIFHLVYQVKTTRATRRGLVALAKKAAGRL
jgi:hypothetical protein